MKRYLFPIFIFFTLQSFAQFNDTTNYYTTLIATGVINKTNDRNAYLLNNSFRFSIYKKHIAFNSSTNYIYGKLNDNLSNRDFNSALDFNIYDNTKRFYYWGLGVYEKSFSLKITDRLQAGAGIGYMLIDTAYAVINISDGILYEYSDLTNAEGVPSMYETARNSFRLKFRFIIVKNMTIDGSHFLQHALDDRHDYIVRSNTNLSYKLMKWLSFTTSVTYNKLSVTQRENLLVNFGLTLERYF